MEPWYVTREWHTNSADYAREIFDGMKGLGSGVVDEPQIEYIRKAYRPVAGLKWRVRIKFFREQAPRAADEYERRMAAAHVGFRRG